MQEPFNSILTEASAKQVTKDQVTNFIPSADIPLELALHILRFLDVKTWRLTAQVCRNWHLLANDPSLWQSQEEYYMQGNLWHYLFKQPITSSYQQYLAAVFQAPGLNRNNLIAHLRLIENEAFKSAELVLSSEKEELTKVKELISSYFGSIDFNWIDAHLLKLPNSIAQLSPLLREKCLRKTLNTIEDSLTRQLVLSLLIKIHSLDIALSELLFLDNLMFYKTRGIQEFIDSPVGKLLENKQAIRLILALKDYPLMRHAPATTLALLSRFNGDELIGLAQYQEELALFILGQATLTHSMNDNQLLTLFSNIPMYKLEDIFAQLLEKDKALLPRLNADFLISLCQLDEEYTEDLPFLILTHPALIYRLSADQISNLINAARKSHSLTISNVFSSEVFQHYVLNLKDPHAFLLSLPVFKELYTLDWCAELLTSEDALNAIDNASKTGESSLIIAEAVANQKILLAKFNDQQLAELANEHLEIAIVLLRNEKLVNRWQFGILSSIRKEARYHKLQPEIEAEIIKIEIQHKEDRKQPCIRKEKSELTESDETQSWPETTALRFSGTSSSYIHRLNFCSSRTQSSRLSNLAKTTPTQQPAPSLFTEEESFANSPGF